MVDQQQLLESVVTMKGKRTKRSRPLSPLALATMDTENEARGGENSSDGSVEWVGPTVHGSSEEEDMAHCLMLLAQGSKMSNNKTLRLGPTKSSNNYDCKTCNKSFPSFQALGGHRASHKKTKLGLGLVPEPNKSSIFNLLSDRNQQLYDHQSNLQDGTALSLHITNNPNSRNTNNNNNKVAKVHECSICGAEFSSGQALGGHMRRHRPIGGSGTHATPMITNPNSMVISGSPNNAIRDNQEIKTQNFLSLDLNLPAPEDDHHHHHHHQQQQPHEERDNSKFVFPLNGKTLIFSASSLVDCHY